MWCDVLISTIRKSITACFTWAILHWMDYQLSVTIHIFVKRVIHNNEKHVLNIASLVRYKHSNMSVFLSTINQNLSWGTTFAMSHHFFLLAPELFFLILAHPVYKMWIIQEQNTLELWNKLHFEEEKTESIYHV